MSTSSPTTTSTKSNVDMTLDILRTAAPDSARQSPEPSNMARDAFAIALSTSIVVFILLVLAIFLGVQAKRGRLIMSEAGTGEPLAQQAHLLTINPAFEEPPEYEDDMFKSDAETMATLSGTSPSTYSETSFSPLQCSSELRGPNDDLDLAGAPSEFAIFDAAVFLDAAAGNVQALKHSLASRQDVNSHQNVKQQTLLHVAALMSRADAISYMIEQGADPDSLDADVCYHHVTAHVH